MVVNHMLSFRNTAKFWAANLPKFANYNTVNIIMGSYCTYMQGQL